MAREFPGRLLRREKHRADVSYGQERCNICKTHYEECWREHTYFKVMSEPGDLLAPEESYQP
jgi:hypothetical protein